MRGGGQCRSWLKKRQRFTFRLRQESDQIPTEVINWCGWFSDKNPREAPLSPILYAANTLTSLVQMIDRQRARTPVKSGDRKRRLKGQGTADQDVLARHRSKPFLSSESFSQDDRSAKTEESATKIGDLLKFYPKTPNPLILEPSPSLPTTED
jgi:NADH:ubiquinone oxidoreductase subunit